LDSGKIAEIERLSRWRDSIILIEVFNSLIEVFNSLIEIFNSLIDGFNNPMEVLTMQRFNMQRFNKLMEVFYE
jgi:hypothetical protein